MGESFEYSNPNFVVLGLLVERVSGRSWQEYVRTHIFEPLAMTNSFATLDEAEAGGLTSTHVYWFGLPRATRGAYLEGLAPTGYVYSSAEDLARYLLMHRQGGTLDGRQVLEDELVAELFDPGPTPRTFELQSHQFRAHYGAGWFIGPFGSAEDAIWHGGTLPHFIAWMVMLPETDQAVVVLINASHQLPVTGANEVFVRIPLGVVDLLRGEAPPTGLSLTRFYILFDALALMVLSLQSWSLDRVVRSRPRVLPDGARRAIAFIPLLWELGVSVALLVLLGLSWAAISTSTPDLAWTIVAISLLWLAAGIVRSVNLGRAIRQVYSRPAPAEAEA